jgi:hypothetical protein
VAEQVPSGSQGQAALTRDVSAHPTQHGRTTSWVASCIIIAGFIVGGIALCVGPAWWLFWTGTGIVVLGALFGAANHIMDDWY